MYGEYGCGKSTKWVLNNTSVNVIAVDTSSGWVDVVKNENKRDNSRLNIYHSNLGDVPKHASRGRPVNYEKKDCIPDYTDYLWTQADCPGACFS